MDLGPDVGTIVLWGVAILIIVEVFLVGHWVAQVRDESRRQTRIHLIMMWIAHPELSPVGSRTSLAGWISMNKGGRVQVWLAGIAWPGVATESLRLVDSVAVTGFHGDMALVSNQKQPIQK